MDASLAELIPAWVDGRLVPVGKLEVHQRGLRHKAVSVFVLDGTRVLIQKRAAGKYHTPGLWAKNTWRSSSNTRVSQSMPSGLATPTRCHPGSRSHSGSMQTNGMACAGCVAWWRALPFEAARVRSFPSRLRSCC